MSKCIICKSLFHEDNLTELGLGTNVFQCDKCWKEN
jgi:hypothetical protein